MSVLYQRSLEIERRLEDVLGLIRRGRYSTPRIAAELQVSIPTISRAVTALRERGYDIRAQRQGSAWRYVLERTQSPSGKLHRHDLAGAAIREN
jgi:biotin operon repressor